MRFLIDPAQPLATTIRSLCAMTILLGLMGGNCQQPPSDGDTPGQVEPPPSSGAPVVTVISPTLSRNLPAGSTITITYTVTNSPTDVVAFIDVDDDPRNDNEIVFATNLPSGTNLTADFATAGIVPDVYNIGIRAINSSGTTIEFAKTAAGDLVTITINGLPKPVINSPSNNLEVLLGSASTIAVVFSCNDAENVVSWKVFFDTDQVIDGTEVTIENGTGNADPGSFNTTVNWPTLTVPEGDYSIGLLCTDSAQSQAVAYAAGKVKISSELSIPSLEVTAPAEDRVAFPDEQIEINFAASSTSTVGATITLFLDLDNNGFDGSEPLIASGLPLSATTTTVNSSIIPDGIYHIGGFVEQGTRRSAADYAPGKLTVVGVGDLVVTKPADPLTVTPGTNVSIGWNTNIPNGQGLIDLTLFTADADGIAGLPVPFDPLADEKDLEISPSTATLNTSSLSSGFYVVRVELTPVDENDVPTGEEIEPVFSKAIRITTLPTVLWVGSIELDEDQASNPPLGHFDGVVFEGVNNEDSAGSSLLGATDLDALPLGGGFLIGARFAKPLFTNPNGIGAGAAYLIYNDFPRINRRYPLNAVGARLNSGDVNPNALAGLRFAGIAFDQTPEDINDDGQINIYSEDADGDGRLDVFFEDVDFDGLVQDDNGSTVEDMDLDGFADVDEDGFVGVDANQDGRIDDPSQVFLFDQYVNGALDVNLSEDRDGDGNLDAVGDATWGLSSMALLPDVDGDGLPELALGFEFTDSLSADFRSEVLGEVEPPNFGDLTQKNQFERGGLIVIPSSDEPTILNPFLPGRGEGRVIQLDFVGQGFNPSPDDAADDDDDQDTTGVQPPGSAIPANRPLNGQDVFPYVRDEFGASTNPGNCDPDQIQLEFINNLSLDYPVRARFDQTRFPAGGGEAQVDEIELIATPRSFARICIDAGDDTVLLVASAVHVVDSDVGDALTVVAFADISGMTPFGPAGAGNPVYGVSGFLFAGFIFAQAREADFPFTTESLFDASCTVNATDSCFETIVGPFYGFTHAGIDAGIYEMDSPTHPLAYARTLAEPFWRADEHALLSSACADKCGRVLPDITSILDASAPAFAGISTGFYSGVASSPIGARILGQRVGDRFATAISRSPDVDNRVLVGAPRRPSEAGPDAGAIYQFRMEQFWASGNDLAGLNDFDAPKPHQYIVKEVGSARPDGLLGPLRTSLAQAIVYSGADPGDRLGEAVVGILDFNGDAQPDILMGAPGADGRDNASPDSGAAYLVYRLPVDIEASVSLEKLGLDASDPNRLNGMLINGDPGDQLGRILAGNCDVNGDGSDDLVMGVPLHGGDDAGEVVVLFGGPNLASPGGGFSTQQLVDLGRAIRIQGAFGGDQAGFNVACNGDFDGDGIDDLILSAPFATPRFDSDGDDILDSPGLDLNRDGLVDLDEGGSPLIADPSEAGLVYVIINGEDLSGTLSLSQMGGALQGFIIAGNKGGDNMGGGFETKRLTRSQGLAYAGDVNGDGKSDLLVSSVLADPIISGAATPKTNAGEVYLIHGFTAQQAAGFVSGD